MTRISLVLCAAGAGAGAGKAGTAGTAGTAGRGGKAMTSSTMDGGGWKMGASPRRSCGRGMTGPNKMLANRAIKHVP